MGPESRVGSWAPKNSREGLEDQKVQKAKAQCGAEPSRRGASATDPASAPLHSSPQTLLSNHHNTCWLLFNTLMCTHTQLAATTVVVKRV